MKVRRVLCALLAASLLAAGAARAQSDRPGKCPGDSKLLNGGPTLVYGEGPGTWWGLVTDGLNAAGFTTDAEKIDYLNQIFGTDLTTLDALQVYNLDLVASGFDLNHNGYVCAFELRGTRAYSGDPLIDVTTFGISD